MAFLAAASGDSPRQHGHECEPKSGPLRWLTTTACENFALRTSGLPLKPAGLRALRAFPAHHATARNLKATRDERSVLIHRQSQTLFAEDGKHVFRKKSRRALCCAT